VVEPAANLEPCYSLLLHRQPPAIMYAPPSSPTQGSATQLCTGFISILLLFRVHSVANVRPSQFMVNYWRLECASVIHPYNLTPGHAAAISSNGARGGRVAAPARRRMMNKIEDQ